MKIMWVEDDPVIAKSLAATLEKWQYDTYIATNFQDVLTDFKNEQPHLVLY